MKFATVRLGKTSVEDIRLLATMPGGIVKGAVTIDVVCTQVPEELIEDTVVFVWLGSDNSKGAPTEWTQGFKAVGVIEGITRGAKYNDESTTTLSLKYVFSNAITRLDVLRDCPEAYYWCSSLPIIGLDDHSNQTIRCFAENLERGEVGAFLYSLNSVSKSFRHDIVSIMPEIDNLFWATVKSPKTGDVLGASSAPETNMYYRLDAALKVFAEKRATERTGGVKTYDDIYAEVRAEATRIDGDYLASCDYEAFRNTLNARQVANSFFSRHTDDDKRRLGDFIAAVRQDPRDISFYLAPGNQPNVPGIGPAMLTAFLTRTRPDLFVFFTEQMFESVKFLGLTAEEALPALFTDAYNTYKGIQTAIRDRMRQMGIKAENGNDADYLTVNEFTWFVSDHLDEIKEAIMKQEFKNAPKKPKDGQRKLADAVKGDEMMQRLMAALRTKPFAILAGHSGTGKSQLVRRLAYMTCNDQTLLEEAKEANAPGNYCMVQVKPNWHDSTDLLGYYTEMNGGKYHTTKFVEFICKAYAYPETPFFACLDEMNLAPVEQYFAEFLSAIESYSDKTRITDRLITEKAEADEICGETKLTESLEEVKKHGLTIPRNLFVVGTVNVDETTCQFSRKVLDRAMTILMTAVSFQSMTGENDPADEKCLDPEGIRFFLERPSQTALVKGQMDKLDLLQQSVGDSAFAIAYRFANEYALYQTAFQTLMAQGLKGDGQPDANDEASQATALDHVALMKLLPRIHGEKRTVEGIFKGLKDKLPQNGLSAAMMDAILKRNDEYLTFWP